MKNKVSLLMVASVLALTGLAACSSSGGSGSAPAPSYGQIESVDPNDTNQMAQIQATLASQNIYIDGSGDSQATLRNVSPEERQTIQSELDQYVELGERALAVARHSQVTDGSEQNLRSLIEAAQNLSEQLGDSPRGGQHRRHDGN